VSVTIMKIIQYMTG